MKKAIVLLMAIAATISATAINRLYLTDFTICPGETMQVALILQNDQQFTAFQTDLLLPEGLSVAQEDDEYLFELSNRKASDHSIISKMRDDGALRMVSFSIGVKPYSGNNGAIVVIPVVAAEDFAGPATIGLRFSFLTTVAGEEIIVANESCEVTALAQQIMGDVNGDGRFSISDITALIDYLLAGCQTSFHIQNADANSDGTISIADVTALIDMLLASH